MGGPASRGVRFEREIAESSSLPGIVLVKVPVGYASSRRFAGGGCVDFLGVVDGIPVAIEAKSCRTARFSLRRISAAQLDFLRRWYESGGFSLVLLRHGVRDVRLFLIPLNVLEYWISSGMRSIGANELRGLPCIPRYQGRWKIEEMRTLIRSMSGESAGDQR